MSIVLNNKMLRGKLNNYLFDARYLLSYNERGKSNKRNRNDRMKDTKKRKKIRTQSVSTWSIIITIVLAVIFATVSVSSEKEFRVLRLTTDEYILCQNSAKELQDGSDYLTEQVRMYAMTGKTEYYSMRLVAESYGKSEESLPEEIRDV